MSECSEDIVLAASEICMYLSRKDGIFGDVSSAGVLIEWEETEPCYTCEDAEEGEVRR